MKLGSKESTELLKQYQVENYLRGLAIKMLLAKESEVKKIHGDANLTDSQMNELAKLIKEIRLNIQ